MNRMKALIAVLMLALAGMAALPAAAQPRKIEASGPWTPSGVAVTFPERIGDYQRVQITEYGPDDWSAGYMLMRDGKMINSVTIYVYRQRPGESCDQEYFGSQRALLEANIGASQIADVVTASPSGMRADAARLARYSFKVRYDGEQRSVRSDLYFYCKPGSEWWVKARTTWPEREPMDGDAQKLMRAIRWPSDVAD